MVFVKWDASGTVIVRKNDAITTGGRAIWGDGNYIYASGYYGEQFAIHKFDKAGNTIWRKDTGIWTSDWPGSGDFSIWGTSDAIFAGAYTLAKFDKTDGNLLWSKKGLGQVAGGNDTDIYIGGYNQVSKLNPDMMEIWAQDVSISYPSCIWANSTTILIGSGNTLSNYNFQIYSVFPDFMVLLWILTALGTLSWGIVIAIRGSSTTVLTKRSKMRKELSSKELNPQALLKYALQEHLNEPSPNAQISQDFLMQGIHSGEIYSFFRPRAVIIRQLITLMVLLYITVALLLIFWDESVPRGFIIVIGSIICPIVTLYLIKNKRTAIAVGPLGFYLQEAVEHEYVPWEEVSEIQDILVRTTVTWRISGVPVSTRPGPTWIQLHICCRHQRGLPELIIKPQFEGFPELFFLLHAYQELSARRDH